MAHKYRVFELKINSEYFLGISLHWKNNKKYESTVAMFNKKKMNVNQVFFINNCVSKYNYKYVNK